MCRRYILVFMIIAAVGSIGGYTYLNEKIATGKIKIALGEKQLADGQEMLVRGKARLSEGKRNLSSVSNVINGIKSMPLMNIADRLPVSGTILNAANGKISEGNELVKAGNAKIQSGEKQLTEGKQQLRDGQQRLARADVIKVICGYGAIIFSLLAVVCGVYWRQYLKPKRKTRTR